MASLAVQHVVIAARSTDGLSHHPIAVLGLILLTLAGGFYIGVIAAATFRVSKHYSRAIPGSRALRLAAALLAAGKYWTFLAIALIGGILFLLGR
jgi:hypothetical protein